MTRQMSVFSIERARNLPGGGVESDDLSALDRHREVMEALAAIQAGLRGDAKDVPEAPAEATVPEQFVADYKAGMEQVAALKHELIGIEEAIEETKKELASLHQNKLAGEPFNGVTDELDEVVKGTERATDAILESVEIIETDARNLGAALSREGDRNMAYEIQEQTTKIFEACNFQDLTGQRITKVVNTLRYVEERVLKMIDIWGGMDAFKDIPAAAMPNPAGPCEMSHGPGDNEGDDERASQDDIDALFN